MSVSVKQVNLPKRKSMKSVSDLENIGPASVICFSNPTFCQHVVTHSAEYLELFFTGEHMWLSTCGNHLEHLCFRCDHDQ